jgi:hypothetical protein
MSKRPNPVYVVDVRNSSGTVIGKGPLYNVLSVSVTEELDKIGEVSVTVPASEQRVIDLVSAENQMRVRTTDGAIVTGMMHDIALSVASNGQRVKTVSGPDLLGELMYLNTGYTATYDDADVATEIIGTHATASSLLGGTNWTQGSVEDYGNATIEYNAATRFEALTTLGKTLGRHIRQGSTEKTLDFGVFGADSGIRCTNVHHAVAGIDSLTDIAIIGSANINTISADVENRLFPLGKDRFDMRDGTVAVATGIKVMANRGPTGVTTAADGAITAGDTAFDVDDATGIEAGDELWLGDAADWTTTHEMVKVTSVASNTISILDEFTNSFADNTTVIRNPQFYIEDATSQSTYGVRESCPQFGWIAPVSKSASLQQQRRAANALYRAAQARLTRYKDEYKSYTLNEVYNLPHDLRVGQKVRVVYRGALGVFGGTVHDEIDDDFYVLKIARTFESNGRTVAALEVANVTRPTPNNANLVLWNMDTNRWIGL